MRATRIVTVIIATYCIFNITQCIAHTNQTYSSIPSKQRGGRLVVTLGGGAAIASSVGQSYNFPAANPATDSAFNYAANNSSQTKAALASFIGTEWQIYQQFNLQLGMSFNESESFLSKGILLQGVDLQSSDQYSYQYSIITRQVLATSKLLYVYHDHLYPYVLLGAGASFNKAYNYTTSVPPSLTFTRVYNSHTQTAFSYQLGVGIDMDVAPHLRLGLGYNFADLGKVQLGKAHLNTTSVSGTLSQNHFYTNELLAQLTWII